jgi:hypothetical protein
MKNPLAIVVIRQQSPGIPISLFDMIEIIASEVRSTWDDYQKHRTEANRARRKNWGQPSGEPIF